MKDATARAGGDSPYLFSNYVTVTILYLLIASRR